MAPDTELTDRVIKKDEYAKAGVPRYWIVSRDKADAVHMYQRSADRYEPEWEPQPLARLLETPVPDLSGGTR